MAQPEGMEQAAKDAFDAARKLIAETARASKTEINFDSETYRALTHIPKEIVGIIGLTHLNLNSTKIRDLSVLAGLTVLRMLSLNYTKISDLSPLSGLTGLSSLSFNKTKVTDLSPLFGLTRLKTLYLSETGAHDLSPLAGLTGLDTISFIKTNVSDLSPLAGLTNLTSLYLSQTKVSDLRPLIGMEKLGNPNFSGLWFFDTPAVRFDDTLRRLAPMSSTRQRAKEVLAYLKTLPPWPEPLPWFAKGDAQSGPQSQVTSKRKEPPLARLTGAIKATPAQVKFMLSQPRLTQFTAREVAGQIRFALADVKRATNALPEPLATIEEIADALDDVGNLQLAPKQKQRVEELQLRIAHLEAVIEKLTHQLKNAEKAQETTDALALSQSFSEIFNPAMAEETAKTIGFVARTGVVGGAIYFLGATNPIIAAMLGALAAMK